MSESDTQYPYSYGGSNIFLNFDKSGDERIIGNVQMSRRMREIAFLFRRKEKKANVGSWKSHVSNSSSLINRKRDKD